MNKKRIKFIGRLDNYKKYPRVKGAKEFTYFDENYSIYAGGITNFYPSVSLSIFLMAILIKILCMYKNINLGIHFDLGLFLGWLIDSLLKLWPVKYYKKIKIGWSFFSGIIFISETPIDIIIYKKIERISYWIRTSFYILMAIAMIYFFVFRLPHFYGIMPMDSLCIGAFIPIVGPVHRGSSANYKRLKSAPNDLMLIHHNGSTYSVPKERYHNQ